MTGTPPTGPCDHGPPQAGRPAWHADPAGYAGFERYWDGLAWTDDRRWADPASASDQRFAAGPPSAARPASRGWRLPPGRIIAAAAAALVGIVGARLAVLAVASAGPQPKPYAGLVSATCSVGAFTVDAQAYYRSDGRHAEIYEFLYRTLGGDPGGDFGLFDSGDRGEFNDVNITLVTDGRAVYTSFSPDDRVSGQLYRDPVDLTLDPKHPTYVDFQAIFDVAFAPDPSCAADTQPVPLSAAGA